MTAAVAGGVSRKALCGRRRTYTFLAELRSDDVDAPFLFDGLINA